MPITLVSQQSVGPTLGQKSLDQSLKAGFVGFLAILLFLIIFYRIPGFMAALSLWGYIVFLLAIFKIFGVTLSLAGIAGFVLS
ncbi:MAG: protein translocase subunit SecD, partial [Candidatus Portnoybacteria bacterium]|nr:protein translocase subunit SecD [Candidatus Portnoybacteria bacterium]